MVLISAPDRVAGTCGGSSFAVMSRQSSWIRLGGRSVFDHTRRSPDVPSNDRVRPRGRRRRRVENAAARTPARDSRHQALAVLIGKWIDEGDTTATAEIPSVPILTSDIYEWAPGGFFVVHSAFGKIGETAVGGVEIRRRHDPGRPPRVQRRRRELDRIDGRDAAQGRLNQQRSSRALRNDPGAC
jgi:hypothetical protein